MRRKRASWLLTLTAAGLRCGCLRCVRVPRLFRRGALTAGMDIRVKCVNALVGALRGVHVATIRLRNRGNYFFFFFCSCSCNHN